MFDTVPDAFKDLLVQAFQKELEEETKNLTLTMEREYMEKFKSIHRRCLASTALRITNILSIATMRDELVISLRMEDLTKEK